MVGLGDVGLRKMLIGQCVRTTTPCSVTGFLCRLGAGTSQVYQRDA